MQYGQTRDLATFAARLWQRAAAWPMTALLVLVIVQHLPGIAVKDLWFLDEVRHGGVLIDLLERGDWVALSLNGAPYPDKPPVYFWYLAGLSALAGSTAPWVILAGLAGTAWMMLAAAHRMALRMTGDRHAALAAALILASGYYVLAVTQYARMDLMFTAAITLAWLEFWRGTGSDGSLHRPAVLRGFAFAALAAMIKGPVGVLLPLAALAGHLVWTRRARALADRSVLAGLGIVLAVSGAWAAAIVALEGADHFATLLEGQFVERALRQDSALGIARYAVTLPVAFLPWTFLAVARGAPGTPQTSLLLVTAGSGFVLLTLISEKHEYYLLPLFVPLSILAARRYLGLSTPQRRRFWLAAAALAALIALLLSLTAGVAHGLLHDGGALGDYRHATAVAWLPALALLGTAAALVHLRHRRRAPLIAFAACQTVFIAALALSVFPRINAVLSPRAVAEAMAPYVATGHAPAAWHGRDGGFAYHLDRHYADLPGPTALWEFLEAAPRAVAAIPHEFWWPKAPSLPDTGPAACIRYAGRGILILTRPAPPDPVTRDACARTE